MFKLSTGISIYELNPVPALNSTETRVCSASHGSGLRTSHISRQSMLSSKASGSLFSPANGPNFSPCGAMREDQDHDTQVIKINDKIFFPMSSCPVIETHLKY